MGRDERHARRSTKHNIPGKNGSLANPDRDVYADQRGVPNWGGVKAAHKECNISEFTYAVQIAQAAIDHGPGTRASANGRTEIVSNKRTSAHFSAQVHY